jgi:hypothetical protein
MVVGWVGDYYKALVECILEQNNMRIGAIRVFFLFCHNLAKGEYADEYFVYCCL